MKTKLEKQIKNKEERARETHRKILTAAAKLFARQGFHTTTINDITREIGLTSGAVFHHFGSKEALLEEVVQWLERGMERYSDYVKTVEKGSMAVMEEIIAIMCDHFRRQPEATICLAALATEFAGSDHPMEKRLKQIYDNFAESFARILENHPRVKNSRAAAIAFVGAVQGVAVQGLLRENESGIDELAQGLIDMFLRW